MYALDRKNENPGKGVPNLVWFPHFADPNPFAFTYTEDNTWYAHYQELLEVCGAESTGVIPLC